MRWRGLMSLGVALLLAAAVGILGCAGGDSTGEATSKDPLAGYPPGPTREFIVPGGDNVVQESGREASPEERREASTTVAAWLRARATGRWGRACAYLSREATAHALEAASSITGKKFTSCAKALPIASTYETEPPRDNIKEEGVASLRIDHGTGNAQYHGNDGRDWILPVHREDGEWKVASLFPLDRMK